MVLLSIRPMGGEAAERVVEGNMNSRSQTRGLEGTSKRLVCEGMKVAVVYSARVEVRSGDGFAAILGRGD